MAARLFKSIISLILSLAFLLFSSLSVSAQQDQPKAPDIGAHAAIVVDYPSGRILYAKNEHERMPPASLTKIMTAILALEYGNLNEMIAATPDDLVGESTMGLV